MQEGLRRQYLTAIGVPCLVPRFILRGAAVSPRCDMPGPESGTCPPDEAPLAGRRPASRPIKSTPPAGTVSGATAGSRAPIEALVEPVVARASLRATAPPARSADPEVAERPRQPAGVQFSLTLSRAGDWLVIDQGAAPGRDYLALLGHVLQACGHRAAVQGEAFQWPPALHRPAQLDTSQHAAQQVLHSRIQTLHQRQPLIRLMILGAMPAALMADLPDLPGVQSLKLSTSLWQALADARHKRSLWLELAAAGWL